VVIVINNSDKQVGLYSGGLIFGGGGAYIWNEGSISTCGALIHGGGAYFGGLRYVASSACPCKMLAHFALNSNTRKTYLSETADELME
jgi:hypothetical protein